MLAIRPLLWKNDWPVAGDEFHAGTYEIESEKRLCLEIAVVRGECSVISNLSD